MPDDFMRNMCVQLVICHGLALTDFSHFIHILQGYFSGPGRSYDSGHSLDILKMES